MHTSATAHSYEPVMSTLDEFLAPQVRTLCESEMRMKEQIHCDSHL
jgi:hypothetical protein